MGTATSRPKRKNEVQPPGNTSRKSDKHDNEDGKGTARYATDAHPMEQRHGMHTMSNSPEDTAQNSNSGQKPVMTLEEFKSDAYRMNHENRGMAIIINNKTFKPHLNLSERSGTDVDGLALHATFKAIGLSVKCHQDKTVQEMQKILHDASKETDYHRKSDCFVCAILTHGEEEDVLYGTDGKADFQEILSYFKGNACPGLVGKPKIFFIQACRGKKFDEGVAVDVADAKVATPREISIKKIPIEADVLRAHSSIPGFFSAWLFQSHHLFQPMRISKILHQSYCAWRDMTAGSWFIQALTEMLQKSWKELDLLTILTRVNKMVASKMTDNGEMQIPMISSTLTKDVRFTQKE